MNTVLKSSRGREENQRKKKGGGIESKLTEEYTPLVKKDFGAEIRLGLITP